MTLRECIGQHLIIGLSGHQLTTEERDFIVRNNIGGVILFARNVETPEQIFSLCEELQSLSARMASKTPLFVSIDMEGGRVHRLKPPFTTWPAIRHLGDLDSPAASFQFAYAMGKELLACGINLDFAPDLDVLTNSRNVVIGDRSIGEDPEKVAKHTTALVRGYLKSGIIPCGKHFPGHGNTLIDSHEDLPVEDVNLDRLMNTELVPFRKSFKAGLELVMTSHILFSTIDPEWPCTMSEIFLKKVLREDLRYRGLVITDDLGMKAMANHYDPRLIPVRALQAGVDILLYCNEPEAPPTALDAIEEAVSDGWLSQDRLGISYERIQKFKTEHLSKFKMDRKNLSTIGCREHQDLAQGVRDGRVTLAENSRAET